MISVNEKLKGLREQSGLIEKDIGDFLNEDENFISKTEEGKIPLTLGMIDKLSALYGVSALSLLNEENCTSNIDLLGANGSSSKELQYIAAVNKIALNADFMTQLSEKGVSNEN